MAISRLKLRSADEEILEVEEEVGLESQTIRSMVEDNGKDTTIPLLKVSSKILTKVIEYCTYHVHARGGSAAGASGSASGGGDEAKVPEESVKAWDTEFVKVDMITLCDLVLAANYLNIKSLLDLTGQTVANIIKTMTPEEIRKTFNIKNDFTPEEEEEVRRENQWAFE